LFFALTNKRSGVTIVSQVEHLFRPDVLTGTFICDQQKRAGGNDMKKFLMIGMMLAAFYSGFFGHTLMNARAEEKVQPELNRYYTSIQIRQGDSLWDIANQYSPGSGLSVKEYMKELKQMNDLRNENIHAGEYLTVVYFAE